MDTPSADKSSVPVGLADIFLGFLQMGLSGFGGVLPFARRVIVERRGWLGAEEFNAVLAICQIMPGPNVVNLAIVVGSRFRGARGAAAAALGLLAAPFVIIVLLGALYDRYGEFPRVQAMLRGLSAAAIGLTLATGVKMALPLRDDPFALSVAAGTFVAIAVLHLALPWVLPALLALCVARAAWSRPR